MEPLRTEIPLLNCIIVTLWDILKISISFLLLFLCIFLAWYFITQATAR